MGVVKQRNIAVAIILSIVTCGIYGIYWTICLVNEVNCLCDEPESTSGAVVFLLSLVTCGIYMFIWLYRVGERLDRVKQTLGLPTSNSGVLYCLLAVFGLSVVSYGILQDDVNKLAYAKYGDSAKN